MSSDLHPADSIVVNDLYSLRVRRLSSSVPRICLTYLKSRGLAQGVMRVFDGVSRKKSSGHPASNYLYSSAWVWEGPSVA